MNVLTARGSRGFRIEPMPPTVHSDSTGPTGFMAFLGRRCTLEIQVAAQTADSLAAGDRFGDDLLDFGEAGSPIAGGHVRHGEAFGATVLLPRDYEIETIR